MQLFSEWICWFLKGDEGEKREKNRVPTTSLYKTSIQNFVNLTFCVGSPQYFVFFGKGIRWKKAWKTFSLFTLQSPKGPTPALGPTPPWWTDEAERKGNKCVALGGIGMQLASVPPLSEAIPAWLTRTHTHTRGGILALAGPRGWDISLWPERKRRVFVFTEALCVQRHNHAHQWFMHRYSGATLCFTASIWSDWNTHQHYFIRSLTHWTGSRRLKMTREQKSVQIIRYDWPNRQGSRFKVLYYLSHTQSYRV